nr:immunoglobulin light chain junction region [Homo sapiens]MCE47846.1 immunoglobulin light chain junction region [Homo sapiens]
EDFAVYYCQQY